MIHFKVIRASRLLLTLAIIILVVALSLLVVRLLAHREAPPVNSAASLVKSKANDEVKAAQAFASSAHSRSLVSLKNEKIEIEIVSGDEISDRPLRVLIYHTHTHEAYEQVAGDPYEALEAWRTSDTGHSVVRVGEALASRLRRYGFEVIHDITDHEGSQLSTAYTRSLDTLMGYQDRFDLYIDLHRDAYVDGDPIVIPAATGEEMAPLMLLIGNGNGFDIKPWYDQNLRFAQKLEKYINTESPGLCKPVLVKDGRYNQHIGVFSILVEVGHNHNTLVQACNSVSPLAKAIYELLMDSPDPELMRIKGQWEAAHPYTTNHQEHRGPVPMSAEPSMAP